LPVPPPSSAPALLFKGSQDIEKANATLDRYNSALEASVSYMINTEGITVASSNRKALESFVGKVLSFSSLLPGSHKRPSRALLRFGEQFREKGFLCKLSGQKFQGGVIGVVAMKKDHR